MGIQDRKIDCCGFLLGIGLPLIAAVLWGVWAAPRSAHRLPMPYRTLFIFGLFALSAYLLHGAGNSKLAVAFAILALISTLLTFVIPE